MQGQQRRRWNKKKVEEAGRSCETSSKAEVQTGTGRWRLRAEVVSQSAEIRVLLHQGMSTWGCCRSGWDTAAAFLILRLPLSLLTLILSMLLPTASSIWAIQPSGHQPPGQIFWPYLPKFHVPQIQAPSQNLQLTYYQCKAPRHPSF